MQSKTKLADVILLVVAFIWGATFVIVQNAISFLEPHSFNSIRFGIAAIFLGAILVISYREQLKAFNLKILVSGILLGFWLFIGYAFQTLGLLYTTSSKAGFITGLSVILVPVFAFLLLKTKLNLQVYLGVIAATIGLYLLTMSGGSSVNIGDLLVLVCAIGFAMQIILTGKYSSNYPTLLLTVIQITCVSILSGICAVLFEEYQKAFEPSIIFQPEVIFALAITSLFATAFAFFAQTHFQKFTTATHTALIFATEPVFAAITAYFWLGETLGINGLVGSLLIFIGMILAELPTKKFKIPLKEKEEV